MLTYQDFRMTAEDEAVMLHLVRRAISFDTTVLNGEYAANVIAYENDQMRAGDRLDANNMRDQMNVSMYEAEGDEWRSYDERQANMAGGGMTEEEFNEAFY